MRTGLGRKVLAFVVLVVVALGVLVVLTAFDPFGGNVALTAAVEALAIGVAAYLLTFLAVPRARPVSPRPGGRPGAPSR
jgi:CBS-domain-containing membrane protein